MGRYATCAVIFAWRLRMYFHIGYKPAASSAATAGGYSHDPSATHFPVIPVIPLAAWWLNPSRISNIAPDTTQISLPYRITVCDSDL